MLPTYLASLNQEPILLTAPHSCQVTRGGDATNQKERVHLREHWISTIAIMLAKEM